MHLQNTIARKLASVCLAFTVLAHSPLVSAAESATGRIQDVELHEKGILTTRVVDLQGKPVAGETLTVMYQGRQIASATSDENGYVAIAGLRPGSHMLTTSTGVTACRFWNPHTAPPSAVTVPAVVSDAEIVRGQFGAFNLPMLVYAGLTAAALAVAIEAEGSADDANEAAAALQARVEALEAASP